MSDADNANYQQRTGTTPAEVAQTFFDVCAKENWAEAAKYWPPGLLKRRPEFMNSFTNYFGGLEIVSLGKPFKGRIILASIPAGERKRMGAQGARKDFDYPGVYVPYEIRVKCGDVRKWQLAIRCGQSRTPLVFRRRYSQLRFKTVAADVRGSIFQFQPRYLGCYERTIS